jgi:hypothetical protein
MLALRHDTGNMQTACTPPKTLCHNGQVDDDNVRHTDDTHEGLTSMTTPRFGRMITAMVTLFTADGGLTSRGPPNSPTS